MRQRTVFFVFFCLSTILSGAFGLASSRADEAAGKRRTRVIVVDDFEAGVVKRETTTITGVKTGYELASPAPRIRCMVPVSDPENKAGVNLSAEFAASGKHSLMLQNSKTVKRSFTPGLSWWLHELEVLDSGTLEMSFAMLNPSANASHVVFYLRDYVLPIKQFVAIGWSSSVLRWGKHSLAIPQDTWVKYKLSVPINQQKAVTRLTVRVPGQKPQEFIMPQKKPVSHANGIQFLVNGNNASQVYFDDLDFRVVDEIIPQPPELTPPLPEATAWRDTPEVMLEVFPPSSVKLPAARRGKTVLSDKYYPSGSAWNQRINERWVYHYEIKHTQDKHNSYLLRLGKGGQIYSLRGPFGESIPPSSPGSPWNDEVWQFVAVSTAYNGIKDKGAKERLQKLDYGQSFFIHNSGAYIRKGGADNLYCPLLGAAPTKDGRGYRTINWGLVPQARTVHRSPILYYVQTRDIGDGIIEMTYVVHNFDPRPEVVLDWLNAPWGGTRQTSLPWHYISRADNTLGSRPPASKVFAVADTGGWNLSSATEDADSPSLALVFGKDKHLAAQQALAKAGKPFMQRAPSIYRYMCAGGGDGWRTQDWRSRPPSSFRNYDVAVVIPKFNITPGRTIWYRSYLVVNSKAKTMELAKSLVKEVDYGELTFKPAETPLVPVYLQNGKVAASGSGAPAFKLYSKPVPGSKPLFLLTEKKTGQQRITTDLYTFVPTEELGDLGLAKDHAKYSYFKKTRGYDIGKHAGSWDRLLGYAYQDKPTASGFVKLSAAAGGKLIGEFTDFNLDLWVVQANAPAK